MEDRHLDKKKKKDVIVVSLNKVIQGSRMA